MKDNLHRFVDLIADIVSYFGIIVAIFLGALLLFLVL